VARSTPRVRATMGAMPAARRWYSILYIQVLIAIAIGIAIGYFWPKLLGAHHST